MKGSRVLITCPPALATADRYMDRLGALGIEVVLATVEQQLSEDDLIALIGDVDGIVAGDDPLTARVLDHAPRLKVIARWGVGIDNVDLDAAAMLGIRVINTPGVFADEVADVAIGYLLLLARHLHSIDHAVRDGGWAKPQGRSLAGRTLGIVGLGTIGRAVSRRALAMRMEVIGCDVSPDARVAAIAGGVASADLPELLERSDAVVLCTALTPVNRHLIDREALWRMRSGGWLINVARGALVDEAALVEVLEDGHMSGAALDVFEAEPLPSDSPLRRFDQVILGSHNASNTEEAVARVNELAMDNLLEGLAEVRR
jgi:D-3-phosphoglycerate dehydrogenase